MKSVNKHNTRQLTKFMLSFLIIVVIASVLIIRLTPFGAATSPDSISYLNAAQNIRLISLIFPFLTMILFLTAYKAWHAHHRSWVNMPLLIGSTMLIVMIATKGILTYQHALESWQQHDSPRFFLNTEHIYNNFTMPVEKNFLRFVVSKLNNNRNGSIVTELPKVFEFLTGVKAKQFPTDTITFEKIRTINTIKNGMLVLTSQTSMDRLVAYYGDNVELPVISQYLRYNLFVVPIPLPMR